MADRRLSDEYPDLCADVVWIALVLVAAVIVLFAAAHESREAASRSEDLRGRVDRLERLQSPTFRKTSR